MRNTRNMASQKVTLKVHKEDEAGKGKRRLAIRKCVGLERGLGWMVGKGLKGRVVVVVVMVEVEKAGGGWP